MAASIVDDKSEHCVPFILDRLRAHQAGHAGSAPPPFFIGLNGVQGAGKTTLSYGMGAAVARGSPPLLSEVTTLYQTLVSPPYSLPTAILSIDDLYLTHSDQVALASAHPDNPLVQHRGQPGTHDLALGKEIFDKLQKREPTLLPFYDKSAFNGVGDRAPRSEWRRVNHSDQEKVQVVIFEGWCVGFRALSDEELESKQRAAVAHGNKKGQLWKHSLKNLKFVNDALKEYDALTDTFDAFIHIDAEDTQYVYDWRLQQEAALRASKGSGMTDEQVVNFVNGYYPAYELYTDTLRRGIFPGQKGKQLRLVVGKDRKVKQVTKI